MAYEVLARKWRPQRFEDVVGQRTVTRTLQNAITGGRVAQAFVFAGPRGVGKTTTARILARALNCMAHEGPAADPCGACDACVEIAAGRDIDVLEIDAATHTQVENVREVIIAGLAMKPVRDRYKVFIIDEVHQLSSHSFNALLKSIEEPPPHVVFVMATTEMKKIPDTILSRSQVFEFRAITGRIIAEQLRAIAEAEQIAIDETALGLIARAAEGSLRDATGALDQVVAFAGGDVTAEAVSTVLGLVGRDLLLDVADAVAREDEAAAFALAGRAVEMGHDLRQVCRELSRLVRDMMVVSIDPGRLADPEIAQEGERERLRALADRFSREDLLRAFDVLGRAEHEVRTSSQPRYALEMALLRWIHLQKLTPLAGLIARLEQGGGARSPSGGPRPAGPSAAAGSAPRPARPPASAREVRGAPSPPGPPAPAPAGDFKEALLAEIRRQKKFFHGSVVAQAQKIESSGDRVIFTFAPQQRALRAQFDASRSWIETTAAALAGRVVSIVAVESAPVPDAAPLAADEAAGRRAALKARAMESPGVKALLDVFPAEITDVEEMKD